MHAKINILIHGFGGAPDELRYLADYLERRGQAVVLVSLEGQRHGQWLRSALKIMAGAVKDGGKVNLIGFSMGGLIAANLAAAFPASVNKIVLINTPIYFWNFKIILTDVFRGDRERMKYYFANIKNSGPGPALEFLKILAKSKRVLRKATAPALILQCERDETVRPKSAVYLKAGLGGATWLKRYKGGCHQVFFERGGLRERICFDVLLFLENY